MQLCMYVWLVLLAWLPECHLRSTPLCSACIPDGVEGVMQAGQGPAAVNLLHDALPLLQVRCT
jgi:hypothetical protein